VLRTYCLNRIAARPLVGASEMQRRRRLGDSDVVAVFASKMTNARGSQSFVVVVGVVVCECVCVCKGPWAWVRVLGVGWWWWRWWSGCVCVCVCVHHVVSVCVCVRVSVVVCCGTEEASVVGELRTLPQSGPGHFRGYSPICEFLLNYITFAYLSKGQRSEASLVRFLSYPTPCGVKAGKGEGAFLD